MEFSIYSICFWVGLLFTVASAVVGHLFGGGQDVDSADTGDVGTGGHAEAGFDHTGMPGISVFSPTVIASFITAFGGLGAIFSKLEATKSPFVSAPLAMVGGLIIAGGVFFMFNTFFSKTQSSSESHVASLVGLDATVNSPIPENGVGEISYVQAGTRYTAPAREQNGAAVSAGKPVKITRIVGTQFYVTAL